MGILEQFALTDRVGIVTGAGKGIGAGTAKALAEAGADVVVAARTPEDLDRTAATVEAAGRRALAVPTDVLEREQLEHLVDSAVETFGRVDIVVNNAGGWPPRRRSIRRRRRWRSAFNFNVTTAFKLTRLCVPHMLKAGGGGPW